MPAWSGVSAVSSELIGPALPSSFRSPLPGNLAVEGQTGHLKGARHDQWHPFHSHLKRLGPNEGRLAEGWIVGNRQVVRAHTAGEDRKSQVTNLHLSP